MTASLRSCVTCWRTSPSTSTCRVFNFELKRKSFWFIGSADLMPRNLDHRLEILVPVTDARGQQRLNKLFETLLADETAWTLSTDGTWQPPSDGRRARKHGTQAELMRAGRRRRRVNGGTPSR